MAKSLKWYDLRQHALTKPWATQDSASRFWHAYRVMLTYGLRRTYPTRVFNGWRPKRKS